MTGRSNWEHKNNPGTATERLARALSRPVNEAIKVEPKAPAKEKREPVLPGLNPMNMRASARKHKIDSAVD
jgi:hypothetical protein